MMTIGEKYEIRTSAQLQDFLRQADTALFHAQDRGPGAFCPSGRPLHYQPFSLDPETVDWLFRDGVCRLPWLPGLPTLQQVYQVLPAGDPWQDRLNLMGMADRLYGVFCNVAPDGSLCCKPRDPELHVPWLVQQGRLVRWVGSTGGRLLTLPPEAQVVAGRAFAGCEAPCALVLPATVQRLEPGALCFDRWDETGGEAEEADLLCLVVVQGQDTVFEELPQGDEPDEDDAFYGEPFLNYGRYTVVAPAGSQPCGYAQDRGWPCTDDLDELLLDYAAPLKWLENLRAEALDYMDGDRYRMHCAETLLRAVLEGRLPGDARAAGFAYCELAYRLSGLTGSDFSTQRAADWLAGSGLAADWLRGRALCDGVREYDTAAVVRLILDLLRRGACPEQALLGLAEGSALDYLQAMYEPETMHWWGGWAERWREFVTDDYSGEECDALARALVQAAVTARTPDAAELVDTAQDLADWPAPGDPDDLDDPDEDDRDEDVPCARAAFPRDLLAAWRAALN